LIIGYRVLAIIIYWMVSFPLYILFQFFKKTSFVFHESLQFFQKILVFFLKIIFPGNFK